MKQLFKSVVAGAALVTSLSASAAYVQTIDLFSTDQGVVTDNSMANGGVFSQVGGVGDTTIIGGFRDIGVDFLSLTTGSAPTTPALIEVTGGYLNFISAPRVNAQGLIRWDGGGSVASDFNTPNMGLGAVFNPFGTFFELKTIFSDLGYKFVLDAFTSLTQWSRVELTAHSVDAVDPGFSSYIPLLAFNNCGYDFGGVKVTCSGGGVNWSSVGAIQAIINLEGGTSSVDLTLNQVIEVPEPGTLALAGLGLLGFGALRRRKQA